VFEEIFCWEKNPETIFPSVNAYLEPSGSVEVGTEITPKYYAEFIPGSYTYGPDTNISVIEWSLFDIVTGDTLIAENVNQISGTLPKLKIEDDTFYGVNLSTLYSEGTIPLTNLGNEYLKG
jgi:hypothetical protein